MSDHLLEAIQKTVHQQMANQRDANADVTGLLRAGAHPTATKLAAIEARAVVIETLTQILVEAEQLKKEDIHCGQCDRHFEHTTDFNIHMDMQHG